MDGHAPILDRSIDSQLVEEPPNTWDLALPQTKLVYDNSVNRSTGLNPHKFLYGHKPRVPLDLIPMSPLKRASESAKVFAYRMSELHKSISDQINLSNSRYKSMAHSLKRFKKFDVDDYVMVRMRPERFPQGTLENCKQEALVYLKYFLELGIMGISLTCPVIGESVLHLTMKIWLPIKVHLFCLLNLFLSLHGA